MKHVTQLPQLNETRYHSVRDIIVPVDNLGNFPIFLVRNTAPSYGLNQAELLQVTDRW